MAARNTLSLVIAACTGLLLSACNSGDSSTDSNLSIGAATGSTHVAIRVEAENFTGRTDQWYITTPDNIPTVTPDPDPPHFSTASSNGYMELLPDTRVTHDDTLTHGVNYWGDRVDGPSLKYMVQIPEPGRYYVYVKAYSTGLEDNGIHVGFDNQKPSTGKRIQLCSGKNKWTWSSAQRVPDNHCGVDKTIYLDIPNAGNHEIEFYAREDGFELDQFILLKDPDDGSQNCAVHEDRIRCKNAQTGSVIGTYDVPITQTNDGNITEVPFVEPVTVDLDVDISVDTKNVRVGDEQNYIVKVNNKDNSDSATSVEVKIILPDAVDFISSNNCTANGRNLSCLYQEIPSQDEVTASFAARTNTTGTHRIDSTVTADQNDTNMGNNADAVDIEASPAIPPYDASLSIIPGTNIVGIDGSVTHLFLVSNVGLEPITNAQLQISSNTLSANIDLDTCNSTTESTCTLDTVEPGRSISVPITVSGTVPGLDALTVNLEVSGDENTDDNTLDAQLLTVGADLHSTTENELVIEAESFQKQIGQSIPVEGAFNTAWFVNSDSLTPTVTPDFDTTPPATAANGAYVELLPDTRTGPADPPVLGVSNFLSGEDSPYLFYDVFVNNAGTYTVNARIRSNNEEDAGIHVGLNDEWPAQTAAISTCNPNGDWQWTQNTHTDGQCDVSSIATFTFDTPGLHTIMVAAATDGVELDKLILRLDNSELPAGTGAEPAFYTASDIDLSVTSVVHSGLYSVEVINPDPMNTAIDVDITINGITAESASEINGFDGCMEEAGNVLCKIAYIAANTGRKAEISIGAATTQITATISQANDPNGQNNSTVATPSGGGILSVQSISSLFFLLGIGRLRRHRCRGE